MASFQHRGFTYQPPPHWYLSDNSPVGWISVFRGPGPNTMTRIAGRGPTFWRLTTPASAPFAPTARDLPDVKPFNRNPRGGDDGKPKGKARRSRPVVEDKSFKTLGDRVSSAYLDWITKAAAVNTSITSSLIDQAIAQYARDIGVQDALLDCTS